MSDQQGKELSSLDFGAMIGGPLNAIVKAQAQSALTSATFIKQVGFTHKKDADGKDTDEIDSAINVDFKYMKPNPAGGVQEATLSVPILTILPIPFIQVEEATIHFNAKLLSVTHNELLTNTSAGVATSAKTGGMFSWYGSAQISANYASKSVQRSGAETKDSYGLDVYVKVSQAEMPAGMDKMLSILEALIEENVNPSVGGKITDISSSGTANARVLVIVGSGFGESTSGGNPALPAGASVTLIKNENGATAISVAVTPDNWTATKITSDQLASITAGEYTLTLTINGVKTIKTFTFD